MKADALLRHGYELADIDRLARIAIARHLSRWSAGERDEQIDIARCAMVEILYSSTAEPTSIDLIRAATRALGQDARDQKHTHGIPADHRANGARFATYWTSTRTTPSPEERIVDRLALDQIMRTLPEQHQKALRTFAATGDLTAAADLLGVSKNTFTSWITRGRAGFRKLWHEGETPSKPWGRDRRSTCTRRNTSAMHKLRQRARTTTPPAAGGQTSDH